MIPKSALTGVILAGGKSSRMGTNKALLEWEQSTLAEYLAKEMSAFCSEIIFSGDTADLKSLPGKIIADESPGLGPVSGIASCLLQIKTPFGLFVPCDMPFLNEAVFEILVSSWREGDSVLSFRYQEKIQPLPAVFRRADAEKIRRILREGERRTWKLIEMLNGRCIDFHPGEKKITADVYLNVNSPAGYLNAVSKKKNMVRILFFGSLADKTGKKELTIPAPSNITELKRDIGKEFPAINFNSVIIAVNQNIVHSDIEISAGDEIALMPPFAGG